MCFGIRAAGARCTEISVSTAASDLRCFPNVFVSFIGKGIVLIGKPLAPFEFGLARPLGETMKH